MTTCENFEVYSHQRIRHEMYDGPGSSSQDAATVGWQELAGRLTAIRHYLDSAIGGDREPGPGMAEHTAAGPMIPLGTWVAETQRLADDTRERIDRQISGFTTARDSIPEVPPEPRGQGWQEVPVIDSVTVSDQEADEAFNAEQRRRARAAMVEYQNGTNARMAELARFAPPPAGEPGLRSRGGPDDERPPPSYLRVPDSNRLSGDLSRTSPAVLGTEPPNDDDPS